MFETSSSNPLLDGTVFGNFSLFSSKHEIENSGGVGDFSPTSKKSSCTSVLPSVGIASPNLGMTKNPMHLTTEANTLNRDGCFDSFSKLFKEFKNLGLDDGAKQTSMQCSNANPQSTCDSANIESTDPCCLFPIAKYSQAFGSEPTNRIGWNEIFDMTEGNSHWHSDISFPGNSADSTKSISLSSSMSVSPSKELSKTAMVDVQQTNLQALSSSKHVPVNIGTVKHCGKLNSHDYYDRRPPRKKRGKWSRRNRVRKSRSGTNLRNFNNQSKPYGAKYIRRLVSIWKKRTVKKEIALDKATTPRTKISCNRIPNKEIRKISSIKKFTSWFTQNMFIEKGKFTAFVKDQEGSRFLQEHLALASTDLLWDMFTHLKPDFVAISNNVFGNYVVQKYLELGCDELVCAVIETLRPSILSLSIGIYGCRVVQKILECAAYEQKLVVAQQLAGSIVKFVYDQNGNHVVQKMIQCLNPKDINFVVDEIAGHTFKLSMHPYGSRVIQRLLEKVNWKKARPLLNETKKHILALTRNQWGNYIIQWIIKHNSMERREIVSKLIGHVAELSREKYASNVIEMAFKRSRQMHLRELAEELLQVDPTKKGSYPTLELVVNDQFGNYVVQTLVESSSGAFRQRLLRSLSNCGRSKHNYGKNLLMQVGEMLRKKNTNAGA